jgi:hypothetical protein
MEIRILTGCYYPQVHPRAFRAKELAEEFTRQGHHVEVINTTTIEGFDYAKYTKETGIDIFNLGINRTKIDNSIQKETRFTQSFVGHALRGMAQYLLHGSFFKQARIIIPTLDRLEGADMVMALSTPFVCLYSLSKYVERHGKHFVTIADSGDPFYYSKQSKKAFWFKYIEKKVYKSFDYLAIPTETAIPLYSPLIPEEKIKIIPQGFNMHNLNLFKGELSEPVKFAYAGVFYWDIRNPEFLFSYLNNVEVDYQFYIIMRYEDALVDNLLNKYPNVKDHVIMKYALPHDDLLYELSKMHFLVNIENISNTQLPSKLIDYGISGRPIFSCKKDTFSGVKFENFMNGNYDGAMEIDVRKYDVEVLAKQFIELTEKAKNNG